VQENIPTVKRYGEHLLELSSVTNHSTFYWVRLCLIQNFVEADPYLPSLTNVKVRYETDLHFLFRRLHPRNIMHNLHDDVLNAYFLIKEHVGGGKGEEPFSLDHRVMLLDPYEATDSTPPFRYLSSHPLRFSTYLNQTGEQDVITCFRDAVVGQSKMTSWYLEFMQVPVWIQDASRSDS
jgi:hypothetical protein